MGIINALPDQYVPEATTSAAGLMSAADKTKLNGIATGATSVEVVDSLSDTSTTKALSAGKGKELSDQIGNYLDGTHNKIITNSVDINSVTTPGRYYVSGSAPNAPFEGYMDVYSYSDDFVKQVAYTASRTGQKVSFRTKQGGTWGNWTDIASETSLAELVTGSVHISRCGKLRTLYFNSATFTAAALITLQASDRPNRNVQHGLPGSSSNYLFISSSSGAIGVLGSGGTYQAASGVNICVSYMTA